MPTLEDFQNMLGQVEQEKIQHSTLYRKAIEDQAAEEQRQQEQEQKMGQFFRNVFDDAAKIQRIRQYEAGFRNLAARQQQQQVDNMGIMPLVRAYGGYVRRFDDGGRVTQEDLDRNGWRWAGIDELQDLDPLYKTIDPTESEWLVDNSGRLVPKSTVEHWLNSYERQTPWQAQNDIAADEWARQRMADRFVSTLGITDWTKPQQRQNFWDVMSYIAKGAGLASLPMLAGSAITGGVGYTSKLLLDAGLGLLGGKAVDAASKKLTGNTWGQNVNTILGINPNSDFGDITNIGYFFGPKFAQYVDRAARASFLTNVTPLGYGNSVSLDTPKNKQFKDFFIDIPRLMVNPSKTEAILSGEITPKWYQNLSSADLSSASPESKTFMDPQALHNRLNAQRLAIGEYQMGTPTYRTNPDKTVAYADRITIQDPEARAALEDVKINQAFEFNRNVRRARRENRVINDAYTDLDGLNGGGIGVNHYPNGENIAVDKWDIQPFVDSWRAPFGKVGALISKIPAINKMDPIRMMRGPEFTLQQQMNRYGQMIPSSPLNLATTPQIYTDLASETLPYILGPLSEIP